MPATLPELLRLPKKRRLEIAERLWASVADEDKLPVPPAHRAIIDQRLASYRAGKSKVITHAELMRRLRGS
jgi:putative addiction module component (TIGR02574 family)